MLRFYENSSVLPNCVVHFLSILMWHFFFCLLRLILWRISGQPSEVRALARIYLFAEERLIPRTSLSWHDCGLVKKKPISFRHPGISFPPEEFTVDIGYKEVRAVLPVYCCVCAPCARSFLIVSHSPPPCETISAFPD